MPKTVTVYINGAKKAAYLYNFVTSLANILHEHTKKHDDSDAMVLHGCSIGNEDFRDFGTTFTFNLHKQVEDLAVKISDLVEKEKTLKLNLYGYEQGGAAVLLLCEKLKMLPKRRLEINLCVVEPLSGNSAATAYVDNLVGIKGSLAASLADLRSCKHIKNACFLFCSQTPVESFCQRPLLPALPEHTNVLVDVLPGLPENTDRFSVDGKTIRAHHNLSAITYHLVQQFLTLCGTPFCTRYYELCESMQDSALIRLLELENKGITTQTKPMHFNNDIYSASHKEYVNRFHKEQVEQKPAQNLSDCALTIKNPYPEPSITNGMVSINWFPCFSLCMQRSADDDEFTQSHTPLAPRNNTL